MSDPVLSAGPAGRHLAPRADPRGAARGRPSPSLTIGTHFSDGRTTVVAAGEIDLDTCTTLRHSLEEALSASARGIDLELAGVRFCDCSGLNVLMLVRRHASEEGKTVVVRSASPAVRRLLAVTETSSLFACPGPGGSPRSDGADDAAGTEQEPRAEVVRLQRALRTRPVVDLARGVLMATFGLSPEDAWSVLVTASRNAGVEVHRLAGDLVAAVRVGPLPDPLRQQLSAAVADLSAPPAPPRGTPGRPAETGPAASREAKP